MTERLYRHPDDRVIAGVAGGLAAWLNIDSALVRIAFVLIGLFTSGAFVLAYIVVMIIIPLAPPGWNPRARNAGWGSPPPGWGGPQGGWDAPGSPTWGPTAAPGGAPNPAPTWGTGPTPGWGANPAGGPQDSGQTQAQAPGTEAGYVPGWGTNTAPTQGPWTPPRASNLGIVAGVVLVGLGVWFLIDQYVTIDWDLLWPVAIMVGGGALIAGALMRDRKP